jgi:hypothetical protein
MMMLSSTGSNNVSHKLFDSCKTENKQNQQDVYVRSRSSIIYMPQKIIPVHHQNCLQKFRVVPW